MVCLQNKESDANNSKSDSLPKRQQIKKQVSEHSNKPQVDPIDQGHLGGERVHKILVDSFE